MASFVGIVVTMILKSHKLLMVYDSSVAQAAADYDQLRFMTSCANQ